MLKVIGQWGVVVVSVMLLNACGGGGGGGGDTDSEQLADPETSNSQNRTVFMNPSDSKLYSFSTEGGETLTYFGHRDKRGLASVITMLDYVDAAGDKYRIFYDNQGLPSKVNDGKGTSVEFKYNYSTPPLTSKTAASPLLIDPDLTSIESIDVGIKTISDDVPVEVQTQILPVDPIIVSLDQEAADLRKIEPKHNIVFNVSKCGIPINPTGGVGVYFQGVHSQFQDFYPASPTNQTGRYVSNLPHIDSYSIPETAETVCTAFADTLDKTCHIFNPVTNPQIGPALQNPATQAALCTQTALSVGFLLTPATGAAVGAACGALLAGGTLACDTVGLGTDPTPDGKNIAQMFCSQVEEILNSGLNEVVIQGVVGFSDGEIAFNVPGGGTEQFRTEEVKASVYDSSYPDLSLDLLHPSIDDITTSPNSPKKGQGYSATVELSCANKSELTMQVKRDDTILPHLWGGSYFSSKDSFTVNIPASPTGARDLLKVTVLDPQRSINKEHLVEFKDANSRPVANGKSVSTLPDTSVAFTLSGSDADGDDLSYIVVSQPDNGVLSGTAPNLTYAPAAAFETNQDSFIFKVSDGKLNSETATVSINVSIVPSDPDWDDGCGYDNSLNTGGATAVWSMGDPVPYTGRGLICSDRNGDLWLNHNAVGGAEWLLVTSVGKGGTHSTWPECYSNPAIELDAGDVIGGNWICPF